MKPFIGITPGRIYNKDRPYSPYVYGQMHTYVEAVIAGGGIPLILPMTQESDVIDQMFAQCHGMLFAGGNDITSSNYHEEPRDVRTNDEMRDTFELELLERASEAGKPVLGICRGMQLMNISRGGSLYQDLKTERPRSNNHDGYLEVESTEYLAHTLEIMEGTQLADILGRSQIKSNTHHHQGIHEVGKNLSVNAYAEDDVIEGVEDRSGAFFVGVQCHPESIFQTVQAEWLPLFTAFVSAADEFKAKKS